MLIGGLQVEGQLAVGEPPLQRAIDSLCSRRTTSAGVHQPRLERSIETFATSLQTQSAVNLPIEVRVKQVEPHCDDARTDIGNVTIQAAIQLQLAAI